MTDATVEGATPEHEQILRNIIEICKLETAQTHSALPLYRPIERAILYTGCNEELYKKRGSPTIDTANITRKKLYDIMCDYYLNKKVTPTSKHFREELQAYFKGTNADMRSLLKKFGFTWRIPSKTSHPILTERMSIMRERHDYLSKLKKHRFKNRTIYYVLEGSIDEVNFNIVPHWRPDYYDNSIKGEKSLIHDFSENGILKISFFYKLDQQRFEHWINGLISLLEPNSVIVFNNAPYHGKELNPKPTKFSKKSEIIEWLRHQKVPFCDSMMRGELLNLVKMTKVRKQYKVDEIVRSQGHEVLRLPDSIYYVAPFEFWPAVISEIKKEDIIAEDSFLDKLTEAATGEAINKSEINKIVRDMEQVIASSDDQLQDAYDGLLSTINLHKITSYQFESDMEGSSDSDNDDD